MVAAECSGKNYAGAVAIRFRLFFVILSVAKNPRVERRSGPWILRCAQNDSQGDT